jgi:hypothetical protein
MSVDPLSTWQSEFAILPSVIDDSWVSNLADYIAARLDSKLDLQTYSPSATFVFNKASFIAILGTSSSEVGDGVAKLADGFVAGVTGGLSVAALTSFDAGTPAETFSVVATSIFDPASTALANAKILELESATPVIDINDSIFPEKIRDASLLLTATVIGTDSVSPTPGPLTDALRGVE